MKKIQETLDHQTTNFLFVRFLFRYLSYSCSVVDLSDLLRRNP